MPTTKPLLTDLEELPSDQAEEALNSIRNPKLKAILIQLREHLHYEQSQHQKDSGCG